VRLVIACLLLGLAPIAAVVFIKSYQHYRAIQIEQEQATQSGLRRGEVLFFNASWCGPCRHMKPIVAQLRRQGYHFRDVNVDQNQKLAQKYGIRGIPCFVFTINGSEVHRFSGGTSADKLKSLCSNAAYHGGGRSQQR
jgi:thioredoxin 1